MLHASSPGTWLADRCAQQGMPCVLGHARAMKASPGGKANNDQIAAQKIAVLLRGGMLPQASVSAAALRATRHLLRRRMPLMRQRAELLAHIHNPHSQDNLPELGQKLADKAHRAGVAERVLDPAVQKRSAVDLARIDTDDRVLTTLERDLVQTAKTPEAQPFSRVRSLPGIGKILALVRLDEIHEIHRVPRVQAFVSYGRLVTCAKESAGQRDGTSGTKRGHADRKGAFAEAAVRCLRTNPAGQKDLARLVKNQGQGKALTVLAHTVARAV